MGFLDLAVFNCWAEGWILPYSGVLVICLSVRFGCLPGLWFLMRMASGDEVRERGKSTGVAGGGFVAQLARSVGVYGKPIPRLGGGVQGRVGGSRRGRKPAGSGGSQLSWEPPTPNFNEREREVIANLEEYSAEGLQQLSEGLQESCNAKVDELKDARAEKIKLQEELQEILVTLADGRIASQSAMKIGYTDRIFIKKVVFKYRGIVEDHEARKQELDPANRAELDVVRKLIVKLHDQMHMAQGISKVLDDIEKVRTSSTQLETLHNFHKTDLHIVQAGSRQVLAKAQAHKDALFQALVGLEYRLVRARSQRQERSKELRVSKQQQDAISQRLLDEEQAVLEREVIWLQDQLTIARHAAKDNFFRHDKVDNAMNFKKMGAAGTAGEVSETGGFHVQALQLQIDQLERELAEVHTDSNQGRMIYLEAGRARPPTAGVDGRDAARQQQVRREHMTSQLQMLRMQLPTTETESNVGKSLDVIAKIKALERAVEEHDEELDLLDEKNRIVSELDDLDSLLAREERRKMSSESLLVIKIRDDALQEVRLLQKQLHEKRAELGEVLDQTKSVCNELVKGLRTCGLEEVQKMQESLASSFSNARYLANEAEELHMRIDKLLPVAEGTKNIEDAGQDVEDTQNDSSRDGLEGLKVEHRILEKDVRVLSEINTEIAGQTKRIKALLTLERSSSVIGESLSHDLGNLPPEHRLRKGLAERRQHHSKSKESFKITSDVVAELSALWNMEQGDAPLSWIPSRALCMPLPPGWEQRQDAARQHYYFDIASGISTYDHPNDVKYKGIYTEIKSSLEGMQSKDIGFTADCLEAERLRLREIGAIIELQSETLRRKEAEMQQEHLLAAISQKENSAEREMTWEKRRDEVLKAEINRLRHYQGIKLQEAREEFVIELRAKLVEQERAGVRKLLHDDQKAKLAAEQHRIREKLFTDEMGSAKREMMLQEQISLQGERQTIRGEILTSAKVAADDVLDKDTSSSGLAVAETEERLQKLRLKADMDRMRSVSSSEVSDEVVEYAHYLGMDPEARPDLLWIAHLALTAPLPAGWSEHHDAQGNVYFFCQSTAKSTYEHPMDQPFKAYYSKLAGRHLI